MVDPCCFKKISHLCNTTQFELTTSCTSALEISAILANIAPGDEVIMPSFTFPSTANAFVLRGAIPVWVDIRPDTLNINVELVESAITAKTKAIVGVHYAGIACDVVALEKICSDHNILFVEDAAQAFLASYDGKLLGTFGDFGAISFHRTKNISCEDGGLLFYKDKSTAERLSKVLHKGTNYIDFKESRVSKYQWTDLGSSYKMSDLHKNLLSSQLDFSRDYTSQRLKLWERYWQRLACLNSIPGLNLPHVPEGCTHNGHIFYLICPSAKSRSELQSYLRGFNIVAHTHYEPLHSSPMGVKCSRFSGADIYTSNLSQRILRLPLDHGLSFEDVERVSSLVKSFYGK